MDSIAIDSHDCWRADLPPPELGVGGLITVLPSLTPVTAKEVLERLIDRFGRGGLRQKAEKSEDNLLQVVFRLFSYFLVTFCIGFVS